MAKTRTRKQIAANHIDLECFRLVTGLDTFANEHKDDRIREMASVIDGMRHRIRKHMHKKDVAETS